MSTSRHIDKICIAAVAVTLALTVLFMCGERIGIVAVSRAVKYESNLFDTSYVHQIDIVMNDWDSFLETCENEVYTVCTAVVDGKKYANAAIRAKGNTSLSSVKASGTNRYSFKLEFDQYDSGKSLDGLDKLCLNNLIQDNTMMKDYIVYRMMAEFGVDSPLCSFVYLTVNGEDWGLYLAVEGIEESFLSRTYGADAGELYKPDSLSFGGGRGNGQGFNMDDFDFDFGGDAGGSGSQESGESQSGVPGGQMPEMPTSDSGESGFPGGQFPGMPGSDGGESGFPGGQFPGMPGSDGEQSGFSFDGQIPGQTGENVQPGGSPFGGMGSDDVKLKYIDDDPESYPNIFDNAKTDVSAADQKRLIEALKSLSAYTDLEDVLDTDEVLRYFVVHNFVCNDDSYTGSMIHNYYLHESDGKLSMIPWDYNLAFGTFTGGDASGTVNKSVDSPVSGSVDERPMVGWIFSDERYTEQYHALFSEFLEEWFANGRLEAMISETAEMIRPYVEKDPTKFCTTEEFDQGVEALSVFVALRAEAVGRQLAGDSTAVETGSLNLSDMGTMGGKGGMGGGNTPQNGMGADVSGGFDLLDVIQLTDRDGNAVNAADVLGDLQDVASVTLSDGTTIELASADMQTLMKTDFSKIVSVADKNGNVADLSGYTVSVELPSGGSGTAPPQSGGSGETQNQTPAGQGAPAQQGGAGMQFPGQGGSFPQMSGAPKLTTEASFWILLGVSVLVLAAGLLIAVKKKAY